MKKCAWITLLMIYFSCASRAQSFEVQQLLLNVEKLSQLKQMLADLKKGYEIVYKGYTTIKNISEGNFTLHQGFLNGLMQVSPVIRNYKKIGEIISLQLRIVSEYKSAYTKNKESGKFTLDEIDYMGKVYAALFKESLNDLEALTAVITSGILRMSDDERLAQINTLHDDMQEKLVFLRQFNRQSTLLALQRSVKEKEMERSKSIFGLTN